jgi:hypothetical protein
MIHIHEERLWAYALDQQPWTEQDQEHLSGCAACRAQWASVAQWARELAVAQSATPSPTTLERYAALFDQIQQKPNTFGGFWQQVKAFLTWDSRMQPLSAGVRGSASTSYRQLYTSEVGEVELMVEGSGHNRSIQGDVLSIDTTTELAPALVQLEGEVILETETDGNGRFHLEGVAPGRYRMVITPAAGAAGVEIDALEIV